jgi:hypothetical protein
MANNNTVTITLNANGGQASAVIRGLSNQVDRDLSGSLGRATLGANLMTGAISAGLQTVGRLAAKSFDLFKQAASTQTSVISTAGNVMKIAGYNFKEATSFVEDFQSQMAKVAAVLPGMTSDFTSFGRGIADDVLPAFAGVDRKLDSIERKAALSQLSKLTTFGTLLSKTAQQEPDQGSMQLSYALSGTRSWKSLKKLDFYNKNTTFRNELERSLGGKELKDFSAKERMDKVLKAMELDKSVLDALSESVEGVFGLVNDKLVGLDTGLFGFMRDLDPNTDGTQTALKSINVALLSLFSLSGLFEESSKTLAGLGIILGDPMKGLQDGANRFTNSIKSLTSIFNQFNSRNPGQTLDDAKETLIADLQFFFGNLFKFDGIGSDLAGITNNFISFLNEINWTELFQYLGERVAQAVNELADFIIKLDYGKTLDVILKMIGGLFMGLARFLAKINWGKVIGAIGLLIGGALLAATAAALLAPVVGIIAAVAGIGLVIIAALEAFGFNWDEMWSGLTGVWNSITSTVIGFFSAIDNFFKRIQKKFDEWNPDSDVGKGAKAGIRAAAEVGNPLSGGPLGYLYRLFTGGNKTPNAYNGLNNSSLMNAANRELLNAPPGAGLVMANSSETILNSSQQARIMSAMNSKPGINNITNSKPSVSIGSIIIQTAATNAQEIAKDVVACIERELQSFGQNYVAAPVN